MRSTRLYTNHATVDDLPPPRHPSDQARRLRARRDDSATETTRTLPDGSSIIIRRRQQRTATPSLQRDQSLTGDALLEAKVAAILAGVPGAYDPK